MLYQLGLALWSKYLRKEGEKKGNCVDFLYSLSLSSTF